MSRASQPLIDKALAQIAEYEAKIGKTQAFINQVCEFDGMEPMFKDIKVPGERSQGQGLRIGPDDFFNKPFATAVRDILTMREAAGMTRAASIDEIHAALREGGFNFPFSDVEKQKHGLATSLGKNTVTFRKLPSGLFGLAEWYGGTGKQPPKRRAVQLDEPADETEQVDNADLPGVGEDQHEKDEAAGSPESETPAASVSTPDSADEDGREVAHDTMSP